MHVVATSSWLRQRENPREMVFAVGAGDDLLASDDGVAT
jgi:hypothetical protein